MARRKRPVEEHENHERWLVSYADFITLLFAFFVVMYSISQVNEGKYRVLAKTLDQAFNVDPLAQMKKPALSLDPIQFGDPVLRPKTSQLGIQLPDNGGEEKEKPTDGELTVEQDDMKGLIEHGFAELINEDLLTINGNNNRLEIELKSKILFEPGGAILQYEAEHVLSHLALVLDGYNNEILVEGYTDDIPIKTYHFPSNWELSAARAAAVVRLFAREAIEPERMSVIGFGEFRPKTPNDTEYGRAQNRRVVIVVMKDAVDRSAFELQGKNPMEVNNISLLDEKFEAIPQVDILEIIEAKVKLSKEAEGIEPEAETEQTSNDDSGLFMFPGLEPQDDIQDIQGDDSLAPENTEASEADEPEVAEPEANEPASSGDGQPRLRAVPLDGGGMIFTFDPE